MNEVSKLGQPDEEPIEGRIVGPYEGPNGVWAYIDRQVRDMYRKGSYHFLVDEDGIHDGDTIMAPGGWCTPKDQHYDTGNVYKTGKMQVSGDGVNWTTVGDATGFTYERGPSFDDYWIDEVQTWKTGATVEMEFQDVDPELFRLLTGMEVGQIPAQYPPIDLTTVKWPGGRRPS